MSRRPAHSILAATLALAACSAPPIANVDLSASFVPFVADSTDNVGLGNAIAVTDDGNPFISYFGFPAVLKQGEIPVTRPVGSAFIPAVQLASVNLSGGEGEGIWSRGAVAQSEEFSGVTVPFGPATLQSLAKLSPENSNGTAIAIDAAGVRHVAWTSNTGVWYADSGDSSSIQQVAKYDVSQAGPVGRPGIAVDGDTPWVAWTVVEGRSLAVHAATTDGETWTDTIVAEAELCNGCPPPAPTGVAATPNGPVVLYADPAASAVRAAVLERGAWTSVTVDAGAMGEGLATTTDPDGTAFASYFDGDGAVVLASQDGGSWSTADVAQISGLGDQHGNLAPMTGVAVDQDGAVSVVWDDSSNDTVRMAQRSDGDFQEVEIPGSAGGRTPAVATTPDGSKVFVSWYDADTQDLLMGALGETGTLDVANPSPIPSPEAGGAIDTSCEPDGNDLQLGALADTWDNVSCLAVEAGSKFTVTVDNPSTSPHDFSIYPDSTHTSEGDALYYGFNKPVQPGSTVTYDDISPIKEPGDYFFRCDFHPATMTGAFVVA